MLGQTHKDTPRSQCAGAQAALLCAAPAAILPVAVALGTTLCRRSALPALFRFGSAMLHAAGECPGTWARRAVTSLLGP